MSYLLLKTRGKVELLPVRVYSKPRPVNLVAQEVRWKILNELAEREMCARELSARLHISEQAICHHLKRLGGLRLIHLTRVEKRRGAVARFYRSRVNSVALISDSPGRAARSSDQEADLLHKCANVLEPFIGDGQPNALVVVGSPTEHGEFRARARDGHYAANVALFVGSLLPVTRKSIVRLDTEMTESQLRSNLILIGGPRANTVTARFNEAIPIRFSIAGSTLMISTMTARAYNGDEEGLVVVAENPISSDHKILVLAGNTHLGTAASIIAFTRYTEKIAEGNSANRDILARVVRGTDLDSDGLVDDVEFLE